MIGLHLWQYRHATRSPVAYWSEALRRDPDDARCNQAMGQWHLRRGKFATAETFLRRTIARLTSRNPNPADGEAFYTLGLVLRHLGRDDEAYDAFYKATWNQAWQSASHHALAEIDCTRRLWTDALDHLDRSLRLNTDHLRARDLRVVVLRQLGRTAAADAALAATLALDPPDWWARALRGEELLCDTQTRLDFALDYLRAGFFDDALALLTDAEPEAFSRTASLLEYYRSFLHARRGDDTAAKSAALRAAKAPPDYCFPARRGDRNPRVGARV